MSFSTALLLNDVDDYIAPSQVCVKPVKIDTIAGKTKSIIIGENGSYTAVTEDGQSYRLKQASITLNDCLACSGCITTAESVLVAEHSFQVLLDQLSKSNEKIFVISLSPQSISSLLAEVVSNSETKLSEKFNNWLQQQQQKQPEELKTMALMRRFVADYFYSIGMHLVLDITWARDIALQECGSEFVERFKNRDNQLPVFSGICPGWVCYAEKTHSTNQTPINNNNTSNHTQNFSIIPFVSKVRSPQQIAGALLKLTNRNQIYHVTLMPCFDKKLEASRQEFANSKQTKQSPDPDIDLVLATNEFVQLFEARSDLVESGQTERKMSEDLQSVLDNLHIQFTMACVKPSRIGHPISLADGFRNEQMYRHDGTGSGGYAMLCFRWAALKLFNISIGCDASTDEHVLIHQLHNRDIQEMLLFQTKDDRDKALNFLDSLTTSSRIPYRHLSGNCPRALLSFAVANGFRNIQTVVQYLRKYNLNKHLSAMKSRISESKRVSAQYPFDYVEVMACPGGCLNGGGQLKDRYLETQKSYFSLPSIEPMSNQLIQNLYQSIHSFDPNHECLRTTYREVPKIEIINPSALQW